MSCMWSLCTRTRPCLVCSRYAHWRPRPYRYPVYSVGILRVQNPYRSFIPMLLVITSQMIYHRGGEPDWAIHCWLNVMAHKPWITEEFITVCCSCRHEHGKQYFVQEFLRSMKLLRLHTRFKRHTEVMSWISRAYGCLLCMDLPETNSTTTASAWFVLSASSLPLSVMVRSCHSCVNLSRLRSSGFMLTLRSGSSLSPTRDAGWAYRMHETIRRSSWNI